MQDRTNVSYATARKIRIIKEKLGPDWETYTQGKRIDAAYNELVGDSRKNLFCKLRPETKAKLDEMVAENDTKMAEFIESLIEREFDRHTQAKTRNAQDLAASFTR